MQQGPGEVMVALKLKFRDEFTLTTSQLVDIINALEVKLQTRVPAVKWCFVEPDHSD